MKKQKYTGTGRLRGRVIESFQMDGEYLLRLTVTGGDIEIPAGILDAAHLGDTLLVEVDFLHTHLTVNQDVLPPLLTHAIRRRKSAK